MFKLFAGPSGITGASIRTRAHSVNAVRLNRASTASATHRGVPARSIPPLVATLALAAAAHAWLWRYNGIDIESFLLPWFRHIEDAGPVAAFATPFGNYAPPYLYLLAGTTLMSGWFDPVDLIKALSVAGSLALTAAVWHLLDTLRRLDGSATPCASTRQNVARAALVLILPTTLLNAALMGQCDAMWAAGCVMALAAGIAGRHRAMLAWCGVALAFKLQAVFFAPFVLALLIRRRVPLQRWPIAGLVWIASLVPAWAAGWPVVDLLTIYLKQADWSPALALNAPNIWMVADVSPLLRQLPLAGLALASAIAATAFYVVRVAASPLAPRRVMEAAILAPMLVVGLLPRMHERYFFLADIVAVAVALAWPDRRSIGVAVMIQLGSTLGLLAYLSGVSGLAILGAAPMIVATVMLARPLCQRSAPDTPLAAGVPA